MDKYSINKFNSLNFSTLLNKTSFEFFNIKYINIIKHNYLKYSESICIFKLYDYILFNKHSAKLMLYKYEILPEEFEKIMNIIKK